MPVTKWDPFRDRFTQQDRVDRLFQEGMAQGSLQEPLPTGDWTPAVDVLNGADRVVLRADLPGVEQEDIELRVEDGTLILRGQRRLAAESRPEDLQRAERPQGTFVRSFSLPVNLDQGGIRATQRNGVLEIVLPKKQEARARAIRVEVK